MHNTSADFFRVVEYAEGISRRKSLSVLVESSKSVKCVAHNTGIHAAGCRIHNEKEFSRNIFIVITEYYESGISLIQKEIVDYATKISRNKV